MFHSASSSRCARLLALLSTLLAAACGSGDNHSSLGPGLGLGGFQLTLITVPANEANWQINRPIEFHFNEPVDFSTINLNSLQIRELDGTPATGEFSTKQVTLPSGEKLRLEDVVVFRPTCPKLPAPFADAGLKPNGTHYVIRVVGVGTGSGIGIRSRAGRALTTGQVRSFRTPLGFEPLAVFQDIAVGPPRAVVRGVAGVSPLEEVATHLEIGAPDGTTNRHFFAFDEDDERVATITGVPLNLYSLEETRVAVNLVLNQPVDPSPENITSDRVGIEFLNSEEVWQPLPLEVELVANCSESGALLRLQPVGILPPTSLLRVFISPQFRDLRADTHLQPVNDFGPMATTELNQSQFTPANQTADEVLESFSVGGQAFGSREDTDVAFIDQRAAWGPNGLRPTFGFAGTGGPDPTNPFDLTFSEDVNLDTSHVNLTSADNQQTMPVNPRPIGGTNQRVLELNVRHFKIAKGVTVRVSGPNPLRILATGDVHIDGTLDASGFKANNVQSLLLATVPQSGGAGAAGGGNGGVGSPLTGSSSPRGGLGEGAFGAPGTGGIGGESGYSSLNQRNSWRPGGGGGGRFGFDEGQLADPAKPGNGLVAQRGFDGMDSNLPGFVGFTTPLVRGSFGAISGVIPARGGDPGPSPFLDARDDNDFWGVALNDGAPVRGELRHPHAGAGGGGGGDAIFSPTFPSPVFKDPANNNNTTSDRRGGGGGGGGGSVHIQALGDIGFGPDGRVRSNGGAGGTGESSYYIDRVGGGGGGGSGGHVILETRGELDLSQKVGAAVEALGGPGGLGMPTGSTFEETPEFKNLFAVLQRRVNEGGTGGPGMIQVHLVGDTRSDQEDRIVPPSGGSIEDVMAPDPLVLVPSFGSRSRAQSDWIALGGASPASGASDQAVEFRFGGTDPDGFVLDADGDDRVDPLPPIHTGALASVDAAASGLAFSTAAWPAADDLFLRNPALLEGFEIRVAGAAVSETYVIAEAALVEQVLTVAVEVPTGARPLSSFAPGDAFEVIPRFFRVIGFDPTPAIPLETPDLLPSDSTVQILFQGTGITQDGEPDEAVLVDWTGDITELNGQPTLAFFRFAVVIDIAPGGGNFHSNSPRPFVDFVRVPFRFEARAP